LAGTVVAPRGGGAKRLGSRTAPRASVAPVRSICAKRLVDLAPGVAKVAVIAAACPTGVPPYLVAGRFKTGEAFASNAITLSTILAVASAAFWLLAVEWF
jgi:predicted permease